MTKLKQNKILGFTLLLFLIPSVVFANAGSPMMWFGLLHILILNAFIGIIESAIIKKFGFENKDWKIIVGNYVSMIIGLYYIAPYFSKAFGNNDFWGGQTYYGHYDLNGFVAGMIISYFATLIIEYPFSYWALKNKEKTQKFTKAFLIANTITNVVMFLIYFWINSSGGHW
ncbi:hypothetical protein GCQ56_14615 [Marinifilum sp. N1E240]|uniref:hypothetical protein n=1 Tax=Marinifilum sp. N1E240 TaxID=2608082 RepID=UPI00128B010E|nr:hypothetical protein [Marinifilum sp. N1E240]MPQ48233.1 hypothetical protein [Marinifilum sp. N1E240]